MKSLVVLVLATLLNSSKQGCVIDINAIDIDVPAFHNSTNLEIIYPPVENAQGNRNITIPVGETIIVSCPGGSFTSTGGLETTAKTFYATCNENSRFESMDKVLNQLQFKCRSYDPSKTLNLGSCGNDSVLVQVGMPLGLDIKLLPKILICFDASAKIPRYIKYNLTKSISSIKSYLVTKYLEDYVHYGISGETIDKLYTMEEQMRSINNLLGLPEDSTKYISPDTCKTTPGFCFEMSALSYRGSFVYILEQYLTYRYIDTAPIWSFVFEYNWYRIETGIIDFIKIYKEDLQIYTGTYGITTLPHEATGQDIELYLNIQNRTFPISKFIWKVAYDPLRLRAVVFITVNNPHRLNEDEVVCEDISDSYGWSGLLKWEKTNFTKGYSYACTYQDAVAKIPVIPQLVVEDVLNLAA